MRSVKITVTAIAVAAFLTPCTNMRAWAESDVFTTGEGVHRKIELYVNGSERYCPAKSKAGEEEARLNKELELSKAEGGLKYAAATNALGCFYISQRRFKEAEPLCKKTLELRRAALPENNADIAAALHNMGALYELQGGSGKPAECYFDALQILMKSDPNMFRAYEMQNIGEYTYHKNDYTIAETMFRNSLKTRDSLTSEPSQELVELLDSLVKCLEDDGHGKDAGPFLSRYTEVLAKIDKANQGKELKKDDDGQAVYSGSGQGGPRKNGQEH